ncbi:GntR family transcriptional regulator [Agromyces sp. MMS24-JH15]|uniref:GntR family transcriptional regulator n=1 Tax=Agromyces sp. MMS24-JH15 TaxID=3243765 RepID=UPI003747C510
MPESESGDLGATAVTRVAEALRAEILSGVLGAGTPLREEATAARFGASRHTVRAAFQRLAADRLAVAEPYRGVRVARFGRDEAVALQQYRAALECEAVRITAERYGGAWPAEVLAPARAALAELERLARSGDEADPEAWLEAERRHAELHRALVGASGSARIVEAHAALGEELLLFLLHVRPHYPLGELAREHRELLDDVQSRGPDAMREHLEHSTALLLGDLADRE